jgi:hypothetical protein
MDLDMLGAHARARSVSRGAAGTRRHVKAPGVV